MSEVENTSVEKRDKTQKSLPAQAGRLSFDEAARRLKNVVTRTPLSYNVTLSKRYNCKVYLKREDLQVVRSYKLRGAYNMISTLDPHLQSRGVVCASAGNHAQGFAYSCRQLNIKGVVFMPVITPKQKINQTKMFGEGNIEIKLVGDTFDDCAIAAKAYTAENNMVFIPPFDDYSIIEGQGTVGVEILEDQDHIDYLFVPVGGGGLVAGVGTYFKQNNPETKIIGVEPEGAPAMKAALEAGHPVTLDDIDRFVDGAAVKRIGDLTFEICRHVLDDMLLVPEGKVCTTILKLYNEDAIVVEPAGALSIAALDIYADKIRGKKVVCIVSGSNNDIDRMPEIKERSLQYEGLKHYFLISFAQRPGALKEFVTHVLGEKDDITRFEYMQKTNKEAGPALVGIELQNPNDYTTLLERMGRYGINFSEINKDDKLFGYLI
ncbi:MAG: threonine ammonia-lyase IlvA [Chitinophagaceae bacterium]|nr:threonine ammonia-lyase IlvA [Chitinophagaceae bacterium]MCW5928828.1 threonine ammonia-lyase IlvA [Chitinophagaceae bacterium]